jgi:hypothetical protein
MPCCRSNNEKPTAGVAASTAATPPEQVKAANDEAAKTVHAEEKDERTKKRGCGCARNGLMQCSKTALLFDHLVGEREQRRRHAEA